jgi:hypothetical protein
MHNGLLKLNDAELNWLGGTLQTGGRIAAIDIQKGCPWQCVTCGIDSPTKSKNMPWKDYKTISNSILKILATKNIDVLSDERIDPFDASDPVYYHSQDGKKERTISDIVTDITNRHLRDITITTAGWRPGKNYMQKAMEEIVRDYDKKHSQIILCYSIKTVSKSIMKDYDTYISENKDTGLSRESLTKRFIKESRYAAMVLENLKTLAPIANNRVVGFDLQAVTQEDLNLLNGEYQNYKHLFSLKSLVDLKDYLRNKWKEDPPRDTNGKIYPTPAFGGRYFSEIGGMLNIGNMPPSEKYTDNQSIITFKSQKTINEEAYFAKIDCDGNINIYYGLRYNLTRILVPKEHFLILSQQWKNKEKKEEYKMLAGLQGKNILT